MQVPDFPELVVIARRLLDMTDENLVLLGKKLQIPHQGFYVHWFSANEIRGGVIGVWYNQSRGFWCG